MISQLPRSTLFPYTTLFRSVVGAAKGEAESLTAVGGQVDLVVFLDQSALEQGGDFSLVFDNEDTFVHRSEEHTSELQSRRDLVCRLLLEKKKIYFHNYKTCT